MSNNFRDAEFESLLGCGTYQIFIYVMYQLSVFLQCSNMVFMSFGKVAPRKWYCITNYTNHSSFENESSSEQEKCELFSNGSCKDFYWDTDFYSIVPQWQLVCDRTGIVYLIMSVQMMGVLMGSPIFGQISDAYGRKWTLFFAHLSLVLLDVGSIFCPNWQSYLAIRFLIGLSCGGTITSAYVLLTEQLKAKHRLWVTAIGGWPPSFAFFAGLAYATGDWKRLTLAIAAVGIPSLFMMPFGAESARWQIQKQKLDPARRSLERVTKWNREKDVTGTRISRVTDTFQEIEHPLRPQPEKNGKKYTYWHLCQTKKMTIHLAVLTFAYVSISMITYGVILNNDSLTGDKYVNMVLFSSIRWFSSILTPVADSAMKCCGRKLTTTVSFSIISLCTIAVSVILITVGTRDWAGTATTGLVLMASMMASPVWASLNLTSVEAFPTPIRNIAVGVTGAFTRLGGVIVPVFLYMAEMWQPSPYVLFAVISFLSAILCALGLPETKGKPLPDKMPARETGWLCCCCESVQKPLGTTRSNSFTMYHFNSTKMID